MTETNNIQNTRIINGANPSIIWSQYMDYLTTKGRQMKAQYTRRMRDNNPITWSDLDLVNKDIHDKLDYLMTWDNNLQTESITNNRNRRIRLTETNLHNIIQRVLGEYKSSNLAQY